jgi:putative SbcD/Mre11-related phosphoesterase
MLKIDYIGKCLLIEREGERVLVVGDLHLGYEGSLRNSGVMIPVDLYKQVMDDFEEIFSKINEKEFIEVKTKGNKLSGRKLSSYNNEINSKDVGGVILDKIVLLGDVKHVFGTVLREEWDYIGKVLVWLEKKCKKLVVIEGNHDKILSPILKNVNIVGEDYYIWKELAFIHGDKRFDEIEDKEVKYLIMGHGHPAIKISDGVKVEKFKCFLVGNEKIGKVKRKVIVVPSFFPLIEGSDVREFSLGLAWDFNFDNFDVKVIGKNLEVLDFGRLNKLKF